MPDWSPILDALRAAGIPAGRGAPPRPVGGGDVSAAWRLGAGAAAVFLKTGSADGEDVFAAEADGLRALKAAGALRVPEVLAHGASGQDAWLALEWLPLGSPAAETERLLGARLALQHRRQGESFGWHRDNYIGTIPQLNDADGDWLRFFRERRLLVQLQLADSHGYGGELLEQGARVCRRIEGLFDGYRPEPSLLHGDLWGGNWGAAGGEPVIFDPAVYYGDRETDLAMTRLFGGFGEDFYRAYEDAWPLAEGHERRLLLYQLYHVLNHLNMFGSAWHGRALAMARGLNRWLS